MAENMQKIKLLKLYELLRKETDVDHPISRVELCRRLNEMGISSNVRTLSKDIDVMQNNGFEIMSFLKDKEKFYYVPEHELTIPEIKILIDAVQAASFVTDKKNGGDRRKGRCPWWLASSGASQGEYGLLQYKEAHQ